MRRISKEDCFHHTMAEVDEVLRVLESIIVRSIAGGENVKLFTGFSLQSVKSQGRNYKNPQNGLFEVSNKTVRCRLHMTNNFKDRINKQAAAG